MSDGKDVEGGASSGPLEDPELNYVAPKEKSLDELLSSDAGDEALEKYKKTLLGEAVKGTGSVVVEENDPRGVILKKLALVVPGRKDEEIDLTGDLKKIKKTTFSMKEGVQFRIRIDFIVQREIVTGLKYVQKTSRMGMTVDKMNLMVGSYGPKTEIQSYLTPMEDAPAGVTGRGTYHIHSHFTDDDKHDYLKWEWYLEIKKDW